MKQFIKHFVQRIASFFGLVIVTEGGLKSILLIRKIQRIISEYQIDCILDVGANIGQYGRFLRKYVGYKGLIISYEPDPKCFEILKAAAVSDPLWKVNNFALGKENSFLPLNIMESSPFNSFLAPTAKETNIFSNSNSISAKIEVPVKRLDNELPELQSSNQFENVFLKLDTQGFDLEVFGGASGCLSVIKAIQTEVSVLSIYENMPSFNDSLEVFRSHGYEVSGLYAVNEVRFPHAVEFDCVYLPK